jgi:hypothetical protein
MTTGWSESEELVRAESSNVFSDTITDHAENPGMWAAFLKVGRVSIFCV